MTSRLEYGLRDKPARSDALGRFDQRARGDEQACGWGIEPAGR